MTNQPFFFIWETLSQKISACTFLYVNFPIILYWLIIKLLDFDDINACEPSLFPYDVLVNRTLAN